MKCCRKSTRLSGSAAVALLLCAAPIRAADAADAALGARVGAAIEHAVQARVGRTARVSVEGVSVTQLAGTSGPLLVRLDPSARIGRLARFVISGGAPGLTSLRVGSATAIVNITADVVRTKRPVARGARVGFDDVATESADLAGRPVARVPGLDEVLGSRASRDLAAGIVLGRADILAEPLVRSGEVVRATVRVGKVELSGSLMAGQNGFAGQVIRVVNKESRHTLHARVVGSGEVEVVDVR